MTDNAFPYFKPGLVPNAASVPTEEIDTLDRRELEKAKGYIPDRDLSHAVNAALVLGMPLLVTGEPGTGKTQLAYAVGDALGCEVHKFETKSTSAARDLFYTFDALNAFKSRDVTDQRDFIRYQALGRAILDTFPADHPRVAALLPKQATTDYRHKGRRRSIVLIDEVDKAPRDFPNDLLNEIERLYFRVPELQNIGSPGAEQDEPGVDPKYWPIIILTSNSEKGLPDPFLRRCVYFDIPFPKEDRMIEIVASRIATLKSGHPLLADALDLFYRLRHRTPENAKGETNVKKEPSTAELINWLQLLLRSGADPDQSLKTQKQLVRDTVATLVKTAEDRRDALAVIERW